MRTSSLGRSRERSFRRRRGSLGTARRLTLNSYVTGPKLGGQ
jgi:hypothetical protein